MIIYPPPGGRNRGAESAPRRKRRRWRIGALAAAAVVVTVAAATAVALTQGGPAPGRPAARSAPRADTGGRSQPRTAQGAHGAMAGHRAVLVSARPVAAVLLQAVAGQLTIVGTGTRQARLTGQLRWTGRAPVATTRFDRAAHVLHVSYRCAAASPCTENFLLVVPRHTAVVLRQPTGHVVLAGLAGPLRINASGATISATSLRCPSLVAAIDSGHLEATFAAPPRAISLRLMAAQATLRLPASAAYAVSSHVDRGYVRVRVPRSATAARTVQARITSGNLQLLPS